MNIRTPVARDAQCVAQLQDVTGGDRQDINTFATGVCMERKPSDGTASTGFSEPARRQETVVLSLALIFTQLPQTRNDLLRSSSSATPLPHATNLRLFFEYDQTAHPLSA